MSINTQGNMSHYIRNAKNNPLSIVDLRSPGNFETRQVELHRNYVVLVSSSNRGM